MAISVALSVVLASSEAAVNDDDVFLLTAVDDGGLSGTWIMEHIDYFLSSLCYPATDGTMVVGFTVAIVLAIGSSFTRDGALSTHAAVEEEDTFASWYGATCGPACKSSDYNGRNFHGGGRRRTDAELDRERCLRCQKMIRRYCELAMIPVTDRSPTLIGTLFA
jgi:hypothetical protein